MPFLRVTEEEYQKEVLNITNGIVREDKRSNVSEDNSTPENISNQEIIDSIESGVINRGIDFGKENSVTIHTIQRGRGNVTEVPESLRALIAEEKLTGTSAADLSSAFGVSPSSISAYAHGNTSTASYSKPVDHLTVVRSKISKRASSTLNAALRALSTKDLNAEKSKDLSAIAKDMATVFEKISPVKQKEEEDGKKHLHLHMYAPAMKKVEDYEIIDI